MTSRWTRARSFCIVRRAMIKMRIISFRNVRASQQELIAYDFPPAPLVREKEKGGHCATVYGRFSSGNPAVTLRTKKCYRWNDRGGLCQSRDKLRLAQFNIEWLPRRSAFEQREIRALRVTRRVIRPVVTDQTWCVRASLSALWVEADLHLSTSRKPMVNESLARKIALLMIGYDTNTLHLERYPRYPWAKPSAERSPRFPVSNILTSHARDAPFPCKNKTVAQDCWHFRIRQWSIAAAIARVSRDLHADTPIASSPIGHLHVEHSFRLWWRVRYSEKRHDKVTPCVVLVQPRARNFRG